MNAGTPTASPKLTKMHPPYDIEIAIQDYEFHKRAWWMLSSIVQTQPWDGHQPPKIRVSISTHANDSYPELLERMIDSFGSEIPLRVDRYRDENFFFRGHTRNQDIKCCESEWLLFSDSDMVFHPQFFAHLHAAHLPGYRGTGKLLTAPRHNIPVNAAYDLADGEDYMSGPVEDAFGRCWEHRSSYSARGRSPGAGYFQLLETSWLHEREIIYSDRNSDRPISSGRGNKFFSDRHFRRKLEGVVALKCPPDENGFRDVLKPILHMNHTRKRDGENWRPVCH